MIIIMWCVFDHTKLADTYLSYRNIDNDRPYWCVRITSRMIILILASDTLT